MAHSLTATNITGVAAIANGGSGQSTQQAAIDALTNVAAATNEFVLTKDTGTGNAIFKAAAAGITQLTGDVTAGPGSGSQVATIANDAVTFAKMQDLPAFTVMGNNTGGVSDPLALTATQATAMFDIFTSLLKGLAPASGGGTTNFLRADGTWAEPAYRKPGAFGFRLSAGSTLATILDNSASADLWLTPFGDDYGCALLEDTGGAKVYIQDQAPVQITLAGLTTGLNYDVFVWYDGGVQTELVAWTNDTTRATALAIDTTLGYVKTGELYKRYAGSIRAISATKTRDDLQYRFISNVYNIVARHIHFVSTAADHTYASSVIRAFNNSTTYRVEALNGIGELNWVDLTGKCHVDGTGAALAAIGLAADSTTTLAGMNGMAKGNGDITCHLSGRTIGYHFYSLNESALNSTMTFMETTTTPVTVQHFGIQGTYWG